MSLQKLKELTNRLPPFPSARAGTDGFKEYKVDHGICFSFYLHEDPEVGVHRWFCGKGTSIQKHHHPEDEWIFVYKGRMELTHNGGEARIVTEKQWVHNYPNEVHKGYFPEDTYFLTVMMPPSKEYPSGGRK